MPYAEISAAVLLVALISGVFENDQPVVTELAMPGPATVLVVEASDTMPITQ